MKMGANMNKITKFRGEYFFLSNFYPKSIIWENIQYPDSEHAYVAAKTLDINLRKYIATIGTPGKAKRFGRTLDLRPDWEQVKLYIMYSLLVRKFAYPDLRAQLVNTGDAVLIEGNDWGDRFWGVYRGEGQNWLGTLLMDVRSFYQRLTGGVLICTE
jgi:ribA/ribD-fused uncharacterized protein